MLSVEIASFYFFKCHFFFYFGTHCRNTVVLTSLHSGLFSRMFSPTVFLRGFSGIPYDYFFLLKYIFLKSNRFFFLPETACCQT